LNFRGTEIDRAAAELDHPGLEADARPQARLLEDHRQGLPGETAMRHAALLLALELLREREDGLDLRPADLFQAQ